MDFTTGLLGSKYLNRTSSFGLTSTQKSTSAATNTTSANDTKIQELLSGMKQTYGVSFGNNEGNITGDSTYNDISKSETEDNVTTADGKVKSAETELSKAKDTVASAKTELDNAKASQSSSSTSTDGETQTTDTSAVDKAQEAYDAAVKEQEKLEKELESAKDEQTKANDDKTKTDKALKMAKTIYQNQLKMIQSENTTTTGAKLDTNNDW